jgi:hypothetical protein
MLDAAGTTLTGEGDHVWIDHYRLVQGHQWLSLTRGGLGHLLTFGVPGTNVVREVRSGHLSLSDAASIFREAAGIVRTEANCPEPLRDAGIVYEGDILTAVFRMDSTLYRFTCRPPAFVTRSLTRLVALAEAAVGTLPLRREPSSFVVVREVAPASVAALLRRGQVVVRFDLLAAVRALRRAVEEPGLFVLLSPPELERLRPYLIGRPYLFVSRQEGTLQIMVFSTHTE